MNGITQAGVDLPECIHPRESHRKSIVSEIRPDNGKVFGKLGGACAPRRGTGQGFGDSGAAGSGLLGR